MLAYINWDISPVIYDFGIVSLRWYGLLFALSFVIGYQILEWIFKKENMPLKDLEKLTITLIIAIVVGARLGHCLFYNPGYYLSNPVEILKIWEGGLASHGAGFGILLGVYLFTRKRENMPFFWVFDRVAIVAALAGIFVRLGNLFNSEIYGNPTDVPWAFIFERSAGEIPRHPAQLYEAILFFFTFIYLFWQYKKKDGFVNPGSLIGAFIVLYFGGRIFLEFFKSQQAEFQYDFFLSIGQLLSIPVVLVGIYFLNYAKKHPVEIKPRKKARKEKKSG